MKVRIAMIAAAVAIACGATGAAVGDTGISGYTLLSGENVILYEGGAGTAHIVHGVNPGVQAALVALAGQAVTVYGTFDNAAANSPILVQQFTVGGLVIGALNGQSVSVTGPVRGLSDGGFIISDSAGNGHRLYSTASVSPGKIASFANKTVTVTGTANVTNPSSYINWPIDVQAIG